jgi:hypothetical protein
LRWGDLGTAGQQHDRAFESATAAKGYIEKQIVAQLGKGYVEVAVPGAQPIEVGERVQRKQRFEWVDDDGTRHFREIAQTDTRVSVRGGVRVSGADQVDDSLAGGQRCATVDAATRAYSEIITSLNYSHPMVETERDASDGYVPHTNPELEAECRESPDAPGPWMVYADWLMAQGDVLGDVASRALAGKESNARAVIREHMFALVGNEDIIPELTWRHGFPIAALMKLSYERAMPMEELARGFLHAPLARFVEALRVGLAGFESDNDWAPTLRAICDSPRASQIKELRFDAYDRDEQEISWTAFGDFSFAWSFLPALESLKIKAGAGGDLGEIALPSLKSFVFESGGLGTEELASIVNARWPQLEHLEVWFGDPNYGASGTLGTVEDMTKNVPKLRHLGVVNCAFVDDVIPWLAGSPLLARLSSLDLSKGVMAGRACDALVQNAQAFRHLASLDLSENLLSERQVTAIRAVLDNVIVDDQRDRDDDDDGDDDDADDDDRYVAVGE